MNYIITGGGSGGHIYPALAVADEIKKREPGAKIILVGSRRGLEKNIFTKTSYKSYFLPVGQLHSSVGRLKQLASLLKMPFCFLQSFYILLRYRPKAVLGVGGYASGPMGIVSSLLGFKTYIWEGNATPGITNKLLGRFNTYPFLVFPEAEKWFKKNKAVLTGVPLREHLGQSSKFKKESSSLFHVLFVGGSQGALVFNRILPELAKKYEKKLEGVHIVHQTGLKNYESVKKSYGKNYEHFEVLPYLDPIFNYYEKADLIVCRSGAGTVNELAQMGKASVLVPFPKASDDHQKKNAESMVNKGAAIMMEEKQISPETLLKEILSLKESPDRLKSLSEKSLTTFPMGARETIAQAMIA